MSKKVSMDTIVELHNKGSQFKSMWDSNPIKINKGDHIEVKYGLALHFCEQDKDLEIKFKEEEKPDPREVVNPLEQTNRGEAFADLKE